MPYCNKRFDIYDQRATEHHEASLRSNYDDEREKVVVYDRYEHDRITRNRAVLTGRLVSRHIVDDCFIVVRMKVTEPTEFQTYMTNTYNTGARHTSRPYGPHLPRSFDELPRPTSQNKLCSRTFGQLKVKVRKRGVTYSNTRPSKRIQNGGDLHYLVRNISSAFPRCIPSERLAAESITANRRC